MKTKYVNYLWKERNWVCPICSNFCTNTKFTLLQHLKVCHTDEEAIERIGGEI
jgi:hypothetical protein